MSLARFLPAVAVVGLMVSACGGNNNNTTTTATVPSDLSISVFDANFTYMPKLKDLVGAGHGSVGVLLPDATSPARYVTFDQPALTKAFTQAGYTSSQFAIDFAKGYNDAIWGDKVAQETVGKTNSAGMKLVGEQVATDWKNDVGGTIFQQQFTAHPTINATVEANDGLGNAVVQVLKNRGVGAKKGPTTGQDPTPYGLGNVLTGFQGGTASKAVYLEAQDAVALATVLRAG